MIDLENNLPDEPSASVHIISNATEYPDAPELRGLAGDPAKPLESRTLFGVWEIQEKEANLYRSRGFMRPPQTLRSKLMRYNPELINIGDADLEIPGYPSKYYGRGLYFPTGLSDDLLQVRLIDDATGEVLVGPNRPPPALHWSGWYPSPAMAPSRQWWWFDYVLEFGLGAVPFGDAALAGNWLDISGIGEGAPQRCRFQMIFDPDNDLGQRHAVSVPLSIDALQAEVVF